MTHERNDVQFVVHCAHLYAAACKGVVDSTNECVETANRAVGARNVAGQPSQHEISVQVFASQAKRYEEDFVPLYKGFLAACSIARDIAVHFRQAAVGHDSELVLISALDDDAYGHVSVASHILRADFGPTPAAFVEGLGSANAAIQADIFSYGEDGFVGHVYEPPAPSKAAERVCPWCAETIKAAAIICRFCGRDIQASTGSLRDDVDRAHDLENHGDHAGAEVALREAVALGHPDGPLALGGLLKRNGDYAGAEAAWLEGERRGDMRCACNLAVLLTEQGDAAAAEEAYRRADASGFAAGAYGLGQVLYARGDIDGAIEANRRADALGDADAAYNLGFLLKQRDNESEAEAAFRRADERGSGAGSSALGEQYEQRGMAADAEAAYRRAADRANATGAFNLGALLYRQGRVTEARAAFLRAAMLGYEGAAGLVGRMDAVSADRDV